jgi:steroid 5-alpha reductase family enzyme
MSPFALVLWITGASCALAWLASLISGDTSWVDRLWSVVPVIYVAVFAVTARFSNARLDVMALLVFAWGARLTFNFARKGGYSGVEDYRWAVLRSKMSKVQFQLFNLFFIVLYQNFILWLISMPASAAYEHRTSSFSGYDAVLAVVFVACLVLETVADEQQWRFQSAKYRTIAAGHVVEANFLTSGLFRFSRHPNYFFEIAQWWVIYLFGVVAAHSMGGLTIVGPVLLSLLFVGSTRFTESITLSKYPEYAEYQAETSPVIPWPSRQSSRNLAI